jgi:glycosyltransferase involved in cell wall biosynthesis
MNILHISFSLGSGGAENMLIELANRQSESNFVSIIIVNDAIEPSVYERLSNRVLFVPLKRRRLGLGQILKMYLYVLKHSGVIHLHNKNLIPLMLPLFFLRNRIFYTCHDVNYKHSWFAKFIQVISISKAVQNDLKFHLIPSKMIYNGVDSSFFVNNDSVVKKFDIIQISRLEITKKGQDLLLLSLKKLKDDYGLILKVCLVGGGSDHNLVIKMISDLDLTDQVEVCGSLPKSVAMQKLKESRLLIQPSRFEGFGLTVVEAMMAGVPTLVSDIDGPLEIVQNGRFGFCFKSDSVSSLVEKLLSILSTNDQDLSQFIDSARLYALENFSIEVMAKKYEQFYKGERNV